MRYSKDDTHVTLENGYVKVDISLRNPGMDGLHGCFRGSGNYVNVLSAAANVGAGTRGFVTEVHLTDKDVRRTNKGARATPIRVCVC